MKTISIYLCLLVPAAAASRAIRSYSLVKKWPDLPKAWHFNRALGIAVDSSGNVFLADTFHHRVLKFDPSGRFLLTWGSKGSGDGEFNPARNIAVDSSGNVFVADSMNHRIQKFDSSGKFLTKWGFGPGVGMFKCPSDVAVDSSGCVFVVDCGNHRIQKFRRIFDVKRKTFAAEVKPNLKEEQSEVSAFDTFDGELSLDWRVLRPDPSHYSLSKKPGSLTITTQQGGFAGPNADYVNLFLLDGPAAPGGDFQITTRISSFKPKEPWNQAGLICYNDDDNYLKWNYEQRASDEPCVFSLGRETQQQLVSVYFEAPEGFDDFWLRVTKRGNRYTVSTSFDGRLFQRGDVFAWGNGTVKCVGLFAKNGSGTSAPEVDASFEFFEVRAVPSSPD